MLEWSIGEVGAPIIGLISFLVTLVGMPLAIFGLRLTYLQAKGAQSSAEAAADAVEAFRLKVDHYSAYRDIAEAVLATDSTRRHLMNDAWGDACDSYETAFRAIVRIQQSSVQFEAGLTEELSKMANHMRRFCDRVDAARAGKGSFPDSAKVLSAIRQNHEILSAARFAVEKEV